MEAVVNAIEAGRCSVAVSGSLLKDPDVVLALKDRAALVPMALSGPPVGPVIEIGDRGVARAIAQPDGVLVLIEPELSDQSGMKDLGKLIGRAGHKPKVYVVSRQFNPFAFGALGLSVEHIKGRGKPFLKGLPVPEATELPKVESPKKAAKKKAGGDIAPRFTFVGREEELEALGGILGEGGPVVVSGPHGVGKRLLVDHAIAASSLKRFPDLTLSRHVGFDTLVARLAQICKDAGSEALAKTASRSAATPAAIIAAAVESLQAADVNGVMLVENLHTALGRQGDFFRKSRLEMLLIALLTHTYKLRLVFTSVVQPVLYKEGAATHLRRFEVGGLKGRFLHEIFEGYKAPEFPRERFGPLSEKIHGHPMAARAYAIEVRDRPDGIKLTEDAKFMKMEGIADVEAVRKRIAKKVEKLSKADRGALAAIAHLPRAATSQELAGLGIARKTRLMLLAIGALDMVGTEENRLYRVHPLVRSQLTWRETSDIEQSRSLADGVWSDLKDATGLHKLVLQQDLNHFAVAGRQIRRRVKTELPDNDVVLESCIGMIRSKKPNFSLARQRIAEVLNAFSGNADAHLLKLELLQTEERAARDARRDAKKSRRGQKPDQAEKAPDESPRPPRTDTGGKAFVEAAEAAFAAAPVPEIFHRVAGYWLSRRSRHKAIEVLERAIEALPEEARLHCRLGALLLRHGRRKEAIAQLEKAMALEPMLPDAYGLLGMAKRDEGAGALPEAEEMLREAVRLAPHDPVQTARLADLLIHKAAAEHEPGKRSDGFTEAKELLETSLKGDEKAPEALLLLAQIQRLSGGDLDRADWLLKQARRHSERGAERHHRISLEKALVDLTRGEVDGAEAAVRDQAARNPSSHRAFATLARVLEARQQFIPAHAEFLRAKERAPQGSLWAAQYDAELLRMQGLIEAQAAGLLTPQPAEDPALSDASGPNAPSAPTATGNTAHRVIRRKRDDGASSEAATEAPTEAAEAPVDAEPEAEAAEAPVDAAAEAPAEAEPEAEAPADDAPPADGAPEPSEG